MNIKIVSPSEAEKGSKETFNFLIDGNMELAPNLQQQPFYPTYKAAFSDAVKRVKQLKKNK